MSTVVKNPQPKARFQESSQNISKHRDMVESTEFQRACDFALLQYTALMTQTALDNFNIAAACHFKLAGAQEFILTLRTLAESATPSASPIVTALDFKA
jgi:hypothetical protein